MKAFPDAVEQMAARAAERAQDVDVPNTQFSRYVMPPNGTDDLLKRRTGPLDVRIDECWEAHPPSSVFKQLRSSDDTPRLASFEKTLRDELVPVFEDLKEVSLTAFMKETYPDDETRSRHVVEVFERAAALAAPQHTHSPVEAKTYVGVRADDGADRFVKAALTSAAESNPALFQGPSDEVSFFRLALAFAGFQFTPARRGRTYLRQRTSEERAGFYLRPENRSDLSDLVPSAHRLGTVRDEGRQVACLALAYDIAERKEKRGGGTAIVFDGEAFAGYEAWVKHLKGMDGNATRRALEQRLDQLRKRNANGADYHRRLAASRERAWVDSIDREIIEREMEWYAEV